MKSVSLALYFGAIVSSEDAANHTEVEHQRNMNEFKKADKDADGYLSPEELTDAFQLVETHDLVDADQKEFFDKMDDDLDGRVSMIEYRDPMRSFTVLLRKQFEHLDLGNDGSLDEHELAIAQQEDKLETCDANGDGTIFSTINYS